MARIFLKCGTDGSKLLISLFIVWKFMLNKKLFVLLCPAIIYLLIFLNYDFKWSTSYETIQTEINNSKEKPILQKNGYLKIAMNKLYVNESNDEADKSFIARIKRLMKHTYYSTSKQELILLVSSFGRSGSTWVSELISSTYSTFYVYEPFYYYSFIEHKNLRKVSVVELLKLQFKCKFDPNFVNWASDRQDSTDVFRSFFTKHVCRNASKCITESNIESNCKQSTSLLIKTIRTSLSAGSILLNDPYFNNLKIIFLVRDPRASLLSRTRLKWDSDPSLKCQILESDVKWYKELYKQYPKNIHILRYEDLCINPTGEAKSLWKFLKGNADLSPNWKKFLASHSSSDRRSKKELIYNTYRNTSREWQNWRLETRNEKFIQEVEKYCNSSLRSLGYNIFNTINNLRNTSISMLIPKSICPHIPCDNDLFL